MAVKAHNILTLLALFFSHTPCVYSEQQSGSTQIGVQSDPHKWIKFEFFLEPDCTEEVNSAFWVPENYCMLGNFSRGVEGEEGRVLLWHRWTCNGTHVHHHEWAGDNFGRNYCQAGTWNQERAGTPFHHATSNYTAPNGGRRLCAPVDSFSGGPHWNITCDLMTPEFTAADDNTDDPMWLGNCSQEGSGTGASFHCGYDATGNVAGVVHFPTECSYNTNGTHELYGPTNAAKMKYSSACVPAGQLSASYTAVPTMTVAVLLLAALFHH